MLRQILLALCLACCSWAASLQWQASLVDADHPAPEGYRIHRGTATGVYDWQIDVGNALQWPIPDDLYGSFYWAASAYNSAGSSGYSNEVYWQRAPPEPPQYVGAVSLRASKLQQQPEQTVAISRLNYQRFTDSTDPAALSITVPSGTDAVVFIAGYYDSDGLTSVDIDGTLTFTVDVSQSSGSNDSCAIAHYLGSVSAGAHTLNVNWASSRDYVGGLYVIYYSGVDSTGLRDSDSTSGGTSLTFTTEVGDVVIVGGGNDADPSFTNATEINYTFGGGMGAFIADMTADGTSETISITGASAIGWGGIVLRMASAGGASAVPVIMRSYRARRN